MPFINVKTNVSLDDTEKNTIESRLSKAISLIPGKSEAYFMCAVEDKISMMFQGNSNKNIAFVEVKILGSSSKDNYGKLTAEICNILSEEAGVDGGNCYVKFEEVKYWGMDGFMF